MAKAREISRLLQLVGAIPLHLGRGRTIRRVINRSKKRPRYYSSSNSSSDSEDSDSDNSLGSSASSSSDQDSASSNSDQSSLSEDGKEEENRPSTVYRVHSVWGRRWLPEKVEFARGYGLVYLKFSHFILDKVLHEKILNKYPLLSSTSIKAPKLDDYVPKIFSATNSSYGKSYDTNWHQIQGRIGAVKELLSRIWLDLDNIQSGRFVCLCWGLTSQSTIF